MTNAFVTGANGHIGANLVRELEQHGYQVVAFVRPNADLRGLEGTRASVERGDVRSVESVARALPEGALVFHVAAPYQVWAADPSSIVDPAVRGTEAVLRAAAQRKAARVVLTGSCNAVGFTLGAPLDETTFREHAVSPYMKAKREQELVARKLGAELSLDIVTVLPTAVLGAYDFKKTPTTSPFVDALTGRGPVPFGMNLVDVRDVALGHRLAAEKGRAGPASATCSAATTCRPATSPP